MKQSPILLISVMKVNPLSSNPTTWSNTLKQFVGNLPTNCLSVSDHLVGSALKGLSAVELGFDELEFCEVAPK